MAYRNERDTVTGMLRQSRTNSSTTTTATTNRDGPSNGITRDLSHAKVYVTALMPERSLEVVKALN